MPQVIPANKEKNTPPRFGLYRWRIQNPIRFKSDLRVTMQALGWQGRQYLPLRDDISSVSFWRQTDPHAPFPELPGKEGLVIKK